jgi:hypothetical protein
MSEVIRKVLNPSLKSNEVHKKFLNMHRMLENILTYYFENVLNMQEKQAITE